MKRLKKRFFLPDRTSDRYRNSGHSLRTSPPGIESRKGKGTVHCLYEHRKTTGNPAPQLFRHSQRLCAGESGSGRLLALLSGKIRSDPRRRSALFHKAVSCGIQTHILSFPGAIEISIRPAVLPLPDGQLCRHLSFRLESVCQHQTA